MLASKQIQITFVWMEIMPKTFYFTKGALEINGVKSTKSLRRRRKNRKYFDGAVHLMYTRNAAKKGAELKKSVKATLIMTGT